MEKIDKAQYFLENYGLEFLEKNADRPPFSDTSYTFRYGEKKFLFNIILHSDVYDLVVRTYISSMSCIYIYFTHFSNFMILIHNNTSVQFNYNSLYEDLDNYVYNILNKKYSDIENDEWYQNLITLFDIFGKNSHKKIKSSMN